MMCWPPGQPALLRLSPFPVSSAYPSALLIRERRRWRGVAFLMLVLTLALMIGLVHIVNLLFAAVGTRPCRRQARATHTVGCELFARAVRAEPLVADWAHEQAAIAAAQLAACTLGPAVTAALKATQFTASTRA
mmetsp:Transcript_53466/g.106364  ORF Transcript_53466/g.106364 Transcript_53466/m.106364 type:complete len:134 (-) Transcript_53466:1607-2008(-)